MHTHTKEFQEKLSPYQAYQLLVEGNERFLNNLKLNRNLLQQLNDTAGGQYPFAVVLSCMDSRTSVELIFDQGLGEIFSIRIAGNVVNDDIVGSMEYACKVVGTKLIVVLGHTQCGAIHGACHKVEMGNLTGLLEKIKPAVETGNPNNADCADPEIYEKVTSSNVLHSIEEIIERSSIIRDLFQKGQIGIVGGVYSVETGMVQFTRRMFKEVTMERPALANN
jgi:carbonic anhydrase